MLKAWKEALRNCVSKYGRFLLGVTLGIIIALLGGKFSTIIVEFFIGHPIAGWFVAIFFAMAVCSVFVVAYTTVLGLISEKTPKEQTPTPEHRLKSLVELEIQMKRRIDEFNKKRAQNQKSNRFYSLSQILLSALTTLLIAINTQASLFYITVTALITSSLASLAGQLLSKFMYEERMAMNIATVCALYELEHNITMDKKKEEDDKDGHEITVAKVDIYQNRYQEILNSANGQWQKKITKQKN